MDDARLKKILDQIPEETRFFSKYVVQLAESINQALRERNWKKRELARKAQMKESQLSRYLNGSANPNLKTIAKISAALECDLLSFPEFDKATVYTVSDKVVGGNFSAIEMEATLDDFVISVKSSTDSRTGALHPPETSGEDV